MSEPLTVAVNAAREYGINAILMLAGLFGAAISFSYMKPMTRGQIWMTLGSGLVMANYLTPLVVWLCKIPAEFSLGAAFLIGLFGMPLLPVTLAAIKRKLGADTAVGG